ncbi:hypothetical protein QY049_25740 [Bradyrhizobium sp. WYCCWR 13022]|uniref:hypothetical protein n=1 Tax=unclassified Bradyrhizobium TaxID=2631580 RepID=UPI00263B9678|nr:hypothetical protein [Bradyrhizobium sp. WYCCWR 13022]MDN4986566.1 hypothetical protein [Bradyrhizobium sp. WYCCWR 13022]
MMEWQDWKADTRDVLLDLVRRGRFSPDEAEREAIRRGIGPLASKPDPISFDPDEMPWWSLPMALAWIAWRNAGSVREHCAEFRENWSHWVPGSWNAPNSDGTGFERIDGHELKSVLHSTTARLRLVEAYLISTKSLPTTAQMTVAEAEKQLFAALAAGRVVAIAKDLAGNVVDIPQREWPYLELFEEEERDVLKHDALDRKAAFSAIKLPRDTLKEIWGESLVEPYMIEPMMRVGTAGYVPFCSVVHWIMTEAGRNIQHLEDSRLWKASVDRLLPLISTGEVQIIGTPQSGGAPKPIEGHVFAGVLVSEPLRDSFDMITGDKPWISCIPYVDEEHWNNDFNDQLYLSKSGGAAWTHLQVRKSDVIREVSFQDSSALSDASEAPKRKSGRKAQYDWVEAKLFVEQQLEARGDFDEPDQMDNWKSQADLERCLADHFSEKGEGKTPAPSLIRARIGPIVAAWRSKKNSA